jgi:two-component system CheB/CheR fusion protein
VGVGASAGGLEALSELFRNLPGDTGMAFVVVQHLPASSKSLLASLIARTTEMPVADVHGRTPPEPNHVYVVPPNAMLALTDGELCLLARVPAEHHPIDRFFRSLAEERQAKAIGIVVSGTGSDGTVGLQAIQDHGGITFAQDEQSAKFPEMPHSASAAGCVDLVLPPAEIARELALIGRHPYVHVRDRIRAQDGQPWPAADVNRLFLLLRNAVGIDFSVYKSTTVHRRILRRLALRGLTDLGRYLAILREHPEEIAALADDLLIHVTAFFRDREAFDVLTRRVFPQLLKRRSPRSPVRIWVPGCSSGEEVYSIGICLFECLGDRLAEIPVKIFGTDVKDTLIAKARAGVYTAAQLQPVSPDLVHRYFVKLPGPGDRYRIRQDLRDVCIFAAHNLLKDSAYSRLDLISCRNMLIYLAPPLRSRLIPMFHHALKPSGVLMLGESESIGAFGELFAAMDKKHRIFGRRHNSDSAQGPRAQSARLIVAPLDMTHDARAVPPERDTFRKASRLFVKGRYRAGVLVNEALQILQSYGATHAYLRRGTKRAPMGLLLAARKELQPFLAAVVHRAARKSSPVGWERIGFHDATGDREVSIKALPLVGEFERHYVILFRDHPAAPMAGRPRSVPDVRVTRLSRQLSAMREQVRALIEEDESAKEELQSATEEIQSSNEQLQSANEELEHAKEEAQATNEELMTVNDELKDRNQALDRAGMDLQNLLSSLNLPIVMVDRDLRLRRFTPTARQVLNVIASDVGRPITDIRWTVNLPDVEQFIRRTVNAGSVEIRDVQTTSGRWYSVSIRPYETPEGKVDGAVIALVDVSAFKREASDSAEALRSQQVEAERRIELSIAQLTIATALGAAVEAELNLHQTVTLALAEAATVAAATPRILETVCQRTGWARAELWMADPATNALQCDGEWSQPSQDTAGLGATAPVGVGSAVAQQVWRTGEAVWIADSTTQTSADQPTETGTPWHATGAFPIRRVDRLIGVLVLSDREIRERDEPFAKKMERLGRLLGVLFDRKRIEEALQTREEEYRLLSGRLLGLQDEERRQLALDLHDSTAQRLAALTMNLDLLLPEAKSLRTRSRKALAESRALAEQCAREVRTLAYLLHPPLLDEMGLVSAVRWYVAGFIERSGIQVTLDLGEVGRLSGPVETALFRIVQESLTNIHRHAQSPTASIRLMSDMDAVVLEVHDQGRGLRQELKQSNGTLVPAQMGVGIQGMRERVRQLGGTFDVGFTDRGTTVRVRVPLKEDIP